MQEIDTSAFASISALPDDSAGTNAATATGPSSLSAASHETPPRIRLSID